MTDETTPLTTAPVAAPALTAEALREWTAAYAQELTPPSAQAQAELILFRLGDERFAVRIDDIDEVANVTGGVAVAHASALLLGLTNLRGEVLPLLDTGALLGVASDFSLGPRNRTLILRDAGGRRCGLPVDAVLAVESLDLALFQPYPRAAGAAAEGGLIRRAGLAEHGDGTLTLVDASALQRESLEHF
jgi:purine-binding chemotaxis protein CheW